MKQSLQEKILQSSIPIIPTLKLVKIDVESPLFYEQLGANALAIIALASKSQVSDIRTKPGKEQP
ncbi:MAG: hypothetical protein ACFB9N_06320 [Geitlerinemataceae cyanobacterium]